MRKVFIAIVAIFLLSSIILVGCPTPEEPPPPPPPPTDDGEPPPPPPDEIEPVELTMVSFESATHPMLSMLMESFMEELEEESHGLLTINWLGGPEVVSFHEQPGAVASGAVDLYYGAGTLYDEEVPETLIQPFTYVSYEEEVARGFDEYMDEVHREQMNVVWIGRMSFDWPFYMATTETVETPADLEDLVVAVSPTTEASVEAVGMVPFDTEEEYTALERGAIDVVFTPPISMWADGIFEVATHFIDHPLCQGAIVLICNQDKFDSLDPELQEAFREAHLEARQNIGVMLQNMRENGVEEAYESGMTIVQFSEEDYEWMFDTMMEAGWEEAEEVCSPESYERMAELCGR
jgi:TRAP-type C4-dicarboxylate transport system substrate-binding protein